MCGPENMVDMFDDVCDWDLVDFGFNQFICSIVGNSARFEILTQQI